MHTKTEKDKDKVIKALEEDIAAYLRIGGKIKKIKAGEHSGDLPAVIRRRVTVK